MTGCPWPAGQLSEIFLTEHHTGAACFVFPRSGTWGRCRVRGIWAIVDGRRTGEGLHSEESTVAARALEGIDSADGLDEATPARTHGAGGGIFRWRDEQDLDGRCLGFFVWQLLGTGWGYDDRVIGAGGAAGAVGVEAVVANRLTASMQGVAFTRNTLSLIAAWRC